MALFYQKWHLKWFGRARSKALYFTPLLYKIEIFQAHERMLSMSTSRYCHFTWNLFCDFESLEITFFQIFNLDKYCTEPFFMILQPKNMPFWQFQRPQILIFLNFCHFSWLKCTKNQDSKPCELWFLQNGSFWIIQYSQNWFHVKLEWQRIS